MKNSETYLRLNCPAGDISPDDIREGIKIEILGTKGNESEIDEQMEAGMEGFTDDYLLEKSW